MRRSVRATAAAVAVVLSMGAGSSAALAGEHAGAKNTPAHAKPAKPAKGPKAAKLDKDRAVVLREVAREKAAVTKATSAKALRGLDTDVAAAVTANGAEDLAHLDTVVAQVKAATTRTELRAVSTALRSVRPENYHQVVASLKEVAVLTAEVEQARTDHAGNVEAEAALDDAEAALAAAEEAVLDVRATSPKSDLEAVRALLAEAEASLEEADLAGSTDDGTEDDTEDDTEDPIV